MLSSSFVQRPITSDLHATLPVVEYRPIIQGVVAHAGRSYRTPGSTLGAEPDRTESLTDRLEYVILTPGVPGAPKQITNYPVKMGNFR